MAKAKAQAGAAGGQNPFARVLDALADKMKTLGDAADRAGKPLAEAVSPLAGMVDLFQRLAAIPLVGAFTPLLTAFKNLQANLKAAGDQGLSVGQSLSVLGGFVGGGIAAAQNLMSAVKEFAGVLSPVSLQMFDRAVKDTQAAVGVALLPVLEQMTASVREAGELILPVARQLEPVFRRLAETMGERLSLEMEALAEVVTALVPLFDLLAEIDEVLLESIRPLIGVIELLAALLTPIIKGTVQALEMLLVPVRFLAQVMADAAETVQLVTTALAAALGAGTDLRAGVAGLKDAADQARDAMRQMLQAMILLSAAILKMVNADLGNKFIRELLKGQKPERAATAGLRPVENVRIGTAEQFGKDVLVAAAQAGLAGGGRKTPEALLEGIGGELEKLLADNKDVATKLAEAIVGELLLMPGKIVDAIAQKLTWAGKDLLAGRPGWETGGVAQTGTGRTVIEGALRGGFDLWRRGS